MTAYFIQCFIYLAAAVIAVPIAKRLGLGSVLGYLIAGVIIGPVTGLVGEETVTIQHFAEFGVVMMLFLVGLELEPAKLWTMRNRLLQLGGLQIALTTAIVMGIALLFKQVWTVSLAIGLIFALSSTAIVLQTFNEKRLNRTEGAENSFSILLFQDIAVIPMLAFIPLLAMPELVEHAKHLEHAGDHHHEELSLVAGLPAWAYALTIIGSIVGVGAAAHYLSRPLFRFIANTGLREIFTATALMLVIGIAALMSLVGLSPALGTFLAGVIMANSEFRHELESNIDPFKGLLLGLFFITVGAGINFSVLSSDLMLILALTAAVMLVKAGVLYGLARTYNLSGSDRWLLTLGLAQAGEFGFVLLSFSSQNNVLPPDLVPILALVVALSMFLTPGLFILWEKLIVPRYEKQSNKREEDAIDDAGTVVIAGMGRMGQVVNRLLVSNNVKTVVLDYDTVQVDMVRRIGTKAYYGDSTRPELLATAGIEHAAAIVVAIDNQDSAVDLVTYLHHTYPNLKILARAADRGHGYRLRQAGASVIESETYHSALELGVQTLKALGHHPFQVELQKSAYKAIEDEQSDMLYAAWADDESGERFDEKFRQLFIQLERKISDSMDHDKRGTHALGEREWTPPPKSYLKDFE